MSNLTQVSITNGAPSGTGTVSTIDALMQTTSIAVTPTVSTANAYGTNYVVGGLLTFANAFQGKGSGILESVRVTCKQVETSGFTLFLFNANPSNTTWTNAAVAAINAADVTKVLPPIVLNASSLLGTHTILSAVGLGQAIALGAGNTTLYGVLIANAALTNNFTTTTDITVELTLLQDGNS